MREHLTILVTVAVAITAAGCDRRPPRKPAATAPPAAAAAVVPPQLAAAEPFEALTESAFSMSKADLGAAVLKAQAAADTIGPSLPAEAASQLAAHTAQIQAAQRSDNRADLAIASVEAYRTLVSAAAPTKVPREVSLLDYAGFRSQADLATTPVRWADMGEAVALARGWWDALSPRVADPALRSRFNQAVVELMNAQTARDPARAKRAVTAELNLVDELETHFNAN